MKGRRKWFSKKKNPTNNRDNYLCVIIILRPKTGKIIMGKLNEKKKKNNKKWRSITAHDKEANSSKIK